VDGRVVLEARNIAKRYGHVVALDGATIKVHEREVVALIGDNGAGKSTMVKVLSGVIDPDAGEIYVDGQRVTIPSPLAARRLGIQTVYQDLALAPDLDASLNLFLGQEMFRGGWLRTLRVLDKAAMRADAQDHLVRLGVNIRDIREPVETLSGGQLQGVAVARAVKWAAKIVIMDEPMAALGVIQSAKVMELINRVRDAGLSVILVSHRMPDVLAIADRIEVLRLGKKVAEFPRVNTSIEDLVGAMTGALDMHLQEHESRVEVGSGAPK